MVYHDWSDTSFDWKSLDAAGQLISNMCKTQGRIFAHTKEKYGTLRVSIHFWNGTLHSLLYPEYVSCQYFKKHPKLRDLLWAFDLHVISVFSYYSGLHFLFTKWQHYVYNKAYQRAVKQFPHIKDEILVDVDFPWLVKGAKEVQDKYYEKEL